MTFLKKIPYSLHKYVVKFKSCSPRLGAVVIVQLWIMTPVLPPWVSLFWGVIVLFFGLARFEYVNHTILKYDCRVAKNEINGAVNFTFAKELSSF